MMYHLRSEYPNVHGIPRATQCIEMHLQSTSRSLLIDLHVSQMVCAMFDTEKKKDDMGIERM